MANTLIGGKECAFTTTFAGITLVYNNNPLSKPEVDIYDSSISVYMSPTHSGFICLRHRFERASDYGDLDVKGAPESKVAMPFSAVLRVPYEGMMLLMGGTRRVVE